MEINKLNSLVELYFNKCNEIDNDRPFLKWLKPGKPTYSWGDIKERIFKLSHKIKHLSPSLINDLILPESLNILSLLPPQLYVGLSGSSHFKKGLLGSTSSHFLK